MADVSPLALAEGITNVLRAASAVEHDAGGKAARDNAILHLARALEAANLIVESAGEMGACRFPTSSGIQCANLTQAQCASIAGSTFFPGIPCTVGGGGSARAAAGAAV